LLYRVARFRLRLVLFRLRVLVLFRPRLPVLFRLRELVLFRLRELVLLRLELDLLRRRVAAAFRAAADRDDLDRDAEALPPLRPPLREELLLLFLPRPDPLFLPPPSSLLTVAQARRAASPPDTPRLSYPSSMCSAFRFCLLV
jgi:hypothetical protein